VSTNPAEALHTIQLHEPRVDGHEVTFSWRVRPQTELYRRTSFRITFPQELDLSAVPDPLWWRVMFICLHSHWSLLRPCTVELPVRLPPGEREFWQRLVDHVTAQLETYGSPSRPGRAVQIADSGRPLAADPLKTDPSRSVVAFSGGKDSLVLSGLASELTPRPLLVMITSPVPWANDHIGDARRRALSEISRRLPVLGLEVSSDFRTSWELGFSTQDGCQLGVHEVSDLPLYQGVVWAVAAATGSGRCLMASEADLQYNAEGEDHVILHREFPSCAATQSALDEVVRQLGLRQGSLTYPLHMPQIQGMLVRRYRKLAELQFSCWQAPPDRQACSACSKCLQIALIMLAEGLSPRAVGIDPVRVLCAFPDFDLEKKPADWVPTLHERRISLDHVVRALQSVSAAHAAALIADGAGQSSDGSVGQAHAIYARLRADALRQTMAPEPGYITDFLDLVHSDLRRPLESILARHFAPTSEPEFKAMSKRAQALSAWISQPIRAQRSSRLLTRRR
jgi:hypothetical protein